MVAQKEAFQGLRIKRNEEITLLSHHLLVFRGGSGISYTLSPLGVDPEYLIPYRRYENGHQRRQDIEECIREIFQSRHLQYRGLSHTAQ